MGYFQYKWQANEQRSGGKAITKKEDYIYTKTIPLQYADTN